MLEFLIREYGIMIIGFVGKAKNGDAGEGGVFEVSGGDWDSDFDNADFEVAGTLGTLAGDKIAGGCLYQLKKIYYLHDSKSIYMEIFTYPWCRELQ